MPKKIYASNHESKREELKKDAIFDIINCLGDGYSGYYSELHNEVFNTDYYVIGYRNAVDMLEEYGVFDAIEEVMEYEKYNFGEVYTEVWDPEKLANMLYYVIGAEVISEMYDIPVFNDMWNDEATDEANAEIINALREKYGLNQKGFHIQGLNGDNYKKMANAK